ncbi:MAG: chromosome segregation protein SMC [Firmicutes bacterium]|jgi:chromosome segregation protein|nr:chromosome segregation protein SMC [Bacillota bacterium]
MYLKQLNIHGFKSFSDKVKLEFNKGITAVVGPNGSGKSNVSDAVRWVLGEQKAKSLRGDKMEDIIFAGTETRKALGFAEVAITIDNQDQKMPIDYTEVTVTRRVYRSGESEYQINGTNCRLKDIHELFMDTGVGREGYSIIGQGRIDELLSSKADDRRRIFEEAAGIVKYKVRKNEAILKLEKEQQNLIRIEDIISELQGQMHTLQKQSEKAKQYLNLRDKIKYAVLSMFCTDIDNMEQEYQHHQKNKEIALQNKKDAEQENTKQTQQKQILQKQIEKLEYDIQQTQQQIIASRTEQQKTEGDILLAKEQIQHILQNIQRMEKEIDTKEQKKEQYQNEQKLLLSKKTAIDMAEKSTKDRLQQQESIFEKLNSNLNESEKNMEDYKADMLEQIRISTEAKGDRNQRQSILEQFQQRQKQLLNEKEYVKDQIHTHNIHIEVLFKQQQELVSEQQKLEKLLLELENQKNELYTQTQQLSMKQKQIEQQLSQKRSRFAILSDMEKEHEGYYKSVKSILHLKNSQNEMWQGICGAVGELIHVAEKYETAIEIALGGNLQNIVTKTEYDAKQAIQYLKQHHFGRATFLPITAVKGKKLENADILSEVGVLGVASDLITYDMVYDNVIQSLLGRTVIIENMDIAVTLSKKYHYQYRIVTLDGELFHAGGAMTGGSTAKKTTSIFSRSREIADLSESIQKENAIFQNGQKQIQMLQNQIEQIEKDTTQNHTAIQQIILSLQKNEQDKQNTQNLLLEKQQKQKLYDLEQNQLTEQSKEAEKELKEFQKIIEQAEQYKNTINEKLSAYQNNVAEEKEQRDKLLNSMTELKVDLSAQQQNKKAVLESIQRLQQQSTLLEQEKNETTNEIIVLKQQCSEKQTEQKQLEQYAEEYRQQQQKQQTVFTALNENKQQQKQQMEALEQQQKQTIETLSRLNNEVFRIETKQEKITEQKQRLYDEIWEEYQMTYDTIKQQYDNQINQTDYQSLKSDVKVWKNDIRELGHVNVDAIENYKDVKDRYTFLTEQKADILDAEQKLNLLITDLSQMMENRFREQFEMISNNFGEVFREMFGGGKAYLKLSDETKVLESSIEIIAQPPGKSLQNMMLLSGGERALTAIAILFSILKMKPSPFCILDEIEAALDDANVKRYADYLKKFSKDTQFIVITHRKGTMEAADVMYGVTMQEKGVSKMISVHFDDEAYV